MPMGLAGCHGGSRMEADFLTSFFTSPACRWFPLIFSARLERLVKGVNAKLGFTSGMVVLKFRSKL
ncbi:hypothetical protein [Mesorhizobium sp. M0488]|uniref:hypothetical protein n=2 Tax=Mesorhizobium TaxID=68287 RepID=UPI003339B579